MNRTDLAPEHAPSRPRRRLIGGAVALLAATVLSTIAVPASVSAHATTSSSRTSPSCSNGAYSVTRGDGWSIIARKLGTTTRALLAVNGASTRTVLHPGQSICAPAGASGATPPATLTGSAGSTGTTGSTGSTKPSGSAAGAATASCASGTYTVVRGDGWLAIAKKLGVTSKALLAANNATTSTALHPGRTICVPAGSQAPAPAAATPAPAAAPVKNLTPAENEAIIRAAWPDELEEEALRIARRESTLKNNAKNWCCYGLFQIHWNAHKSWLAGIGVTTPEQLFDPTVNANAAYALYQRSGSFRPWAL